LTLEEIRYAFNTTELTADFPEDTYGWFFGDWTKELGRLKK